MSERTFRAVVAAVLMGALALAAIVAFTALQPRSDGPASRVTLAPTVPSAPTAPPASTPTTTTAPTRAPTLPPTPRLVFDAVGVAGVGEVPRNGASTTTLVLRFTESAIDAIPGAAGSFTVTLTDSAGAGTTLEFTGIPTIDAPDSLGVTAEFGSPNVLRISIVGSDRFNIEPITVTGLGISAGSDAALGPISAVVGAFSGSLAGGVANPVLPSPGTVVAGP